MSEPPPGIIVANCSPGTGNLGVSALFESAVRQLASRVPDVPITVLDEGRGARDATLPGRIEPVRFELAGAVYTRRLYRAESWSRIEFAARLGGLANPTARRFLRALAVLDVSGGDSFTDLYGSKRFEVVVKPKNLALRLGVPLLLLPQTYGPFRDPAYRERAARIVRGAAVAWARDERSFEVLKELLQESFDPARHRRGVDLAFLLPARAPAELPSELALWLDDDAAEVYGINVSGLIYNDPSAARARYRFKAEYREVILGLVRALLRRQEARVLLVPHVITPPGHYESDETACNAVRDAVRDARVSVLPASFDQAEIKGVIGRMDWFCGTRMHSTIAALSSGVPTAAIAYSPKTLGVFETCGQGGWVADPRTGSTEQVLQALVAAFEARADTRRSLAENLPRVLADAEAQMDHIAGVCSGRAEPVAR